MSVDNLIRAVYRKDCGEIEAILASGLDVNACDNDGRTCLIHSVLDIDESAEMVDFLLRKGADVNVRDKHQQWTSLHFAARDQRFELVKILLSHGAEVDAIDVFGNTPLWRCVMSQPLLDVVRRLLNAGANPRKKNKHGMSALDIAEDGGNQQILLALRKAQQTERRKKEK